MSNPTWITVSEAQRRLDMSKSYYARLCRTGVLVCKLVGNTYLIDPESLRQYEATRDRKPGPKKKQAVESEA
jgi:hypothetical protein